MRLRAITLIACMVVWGSTFAQEDSGESEAFRPHRLTIMMANSHIPAANEVGGQKTVYITPTWALNYDYWFTPKWAVGLHNDFILQKFVVEERGGDKTIERSFPITVSGVVLFSPVKHWTFLAGLGREFEKNESFNLFTVGMEYGIELPNSWELSFNLNYEDKFEVYNSWIFGIGFSKRLP